MLKRFLSSFSPSAHLLALGVLTLAVFALMPGVADASILGQATTRICQVYQAAKTIVYVIGGLGLIVMAIFAFLGRFKWQHFFSLAGGLFLVAMTTELIAFLGGPGASC